MTVLSLESKSLEVIESSKATQIKETFEPMTVMLGSFEKDFKEIIAKSTESEEITPELMAKAKRLRLDIAKVRVDTEKLRKREKEKYLLAGKAIDGVSNILKFAIQGQEETLKDIEDHFTKMEAKKIADKINLAKALQKKRAELLKPYVDDADERSLSGMEDEVWEIFLEKKKADFKEIQDALDLAAKKAKEKAAADKKERLRLAAENKKIIAENLAKEQAAKKVSDAKLKIVEDLAKAKEKKEAAAKKKLAVENAAKLKVIRDKADADKKVAAAKAKVIADDLKLKLKKAQDKENKRAADEAKAHKVAQAKLTQGDKAKFQDLKTDLAELRTKYSFKSEVNIKKYKEVGGLLAKVIIHLQQ